MDWLIELFKNTESVAHIALLYSVVIAIGVYLGKIKIGGISLGVTFVLFAGILAGHLGFTGPTDILTFMQDFGLILFVFMIGLQVGPSFFETFKKGGVKLNMLSCCLILLNIGVMIACFYLFFDTNDPKNMPMLIGTLCGAVTNTPGLGAATEAAHSILGNNTPPLASGYACAYPLGVLGTIGATILIRYLCKINLQEEEEELKRLSEGDPSSKPHFLYLEVENKHLEGKSITQLKAFLSRDFTCSRMFRNGEAIIPTVDTTLQVGDNMYLVCAEADTEAIIAFIGSEKEIDWVMEEQPMINKRIIVTNSSVNGKTFSEMHFSTVYGVNVTRFSRQGMDLFASGNLALQIGDRLMVVGPQDNVDRVEKVLGNSVKRLKAPNIATIFVGIILGIIAGSIPFAIPGIPTPLKLGIAGGPLILAILIGRFGYKFHLVTYTTTSANMMLREIGLVLFLASVGIKAGANFYDTIFSGDGLKYVGSGFLITFIPIIIIGLVARKKYKFNYFTIAGFIAGTCTDPPALAYANSTCSREAPAVSYSTVYPLSMFLRIFTAQVLIILLWTLS